MSLFDMDNEQLISIVKGRHNVPTLIGIKITSFSNDMLVPSIALGKVEDDKENPVEVNVGGK